CASPPYILLYSLLLILASLFALSFTDPAPTEFYPLSLHDALPICAALASIDQALTAKLGQITGTFGQALGDFQTNLRVIWPSLADRKSTRLNSSHVKISYAVFCLKKKIINPTQHQVNYDMYTRRCR